MNEILASHTGVRREDATRHEEQVVLVGLECDLLDLPLADQDTAETLRTVDVQSLVQSWTSHLGVDEEHSMTSSREGGGEVQGDEALAFARRSARDDD